MNPNEVFDLPNIVFWIGLAVVILVQGYSVGEVWPEARRWRFGYITLFGGTLVMVVVNGWDGRTWGALALATLLARDLLETHVIGRVWRRRESARWTAEYFAAYLLILGSIILGGHDGYYDLVTWGKMFASLGIAGMVKVGWEAARDSYRAHRIRQMNPAEVEAEGVGKRR